MSEPLQAEHTPEKTTEKKAGNLVAWLSMVLNLLLAGVVSAALYWLWPQWSGLQQRQQQLSEQQQQSQSTVQQQQQAFSQKLEQQLASLQTQLSQASVQLQQQQEQLRALQQDQQKQLSSSTAWLVWQSQQLVQLAGQKIWLEQDIPAAVRLLTGAEQQLSTVQDPAFVPLRQALVADIRALQQQPLPQLSSIQLELTQLRQQILSLPLRQSEYALQQATEQVQAQDWQGRFWQQWDLFWATLVQVRPTAPEDVAVLSAEQQLSLRNTLTQQLLLAELAALKYQNEPYQSALQQAMDTLQRYFRAADPLVQQSAERLTHLSGLSVLLPVPARLHSAEVLKELELTEQRL
ncbi:uroporphyrinogen-III C-methyltransferase [Rheinheimera sp.]|uniref:uroporphyrinogen-III C-methyltransferase n=1 Tax=Rheinheimera sp. TaxID=1869214 RepID=UPI00307DC8B4